MESENMEENLNYDMEMPSIKKGKKNSDYGVTQNFR